MDLSRRVYENPSDFGVEYERRQGDDMTRRKLTLGEQLKGVLAAIRSKRTPPQLRKGLERRRQKLEELLRKRESKSARFYKF